MSGKYVIELKNKPSVLNFSSVVGKEESLGPLFSYFDVMYPDDGIFSKSWESAEVSLVHEAIEVLMQKENITSDYIDICFGGDLLNQCTASTFGIKKFGIPYCGLFGACSTFAMALCLSALAVDGGYVHNALAFSSSHFCSAEKQFRFPLEYGGQRPQTAQRTVTGAGACLISEKSSDIKIEKIMFGSVKDYSVKDASNMGAAMAPAAYKTISDFMKQTGTTINDYDMILTGDLGAVGSELVVKLMLENENIDISDKLNDCGLMIFDRDKQDVHSGGSGCGCSASVVCSKIFREMKKGSFSTILFVGTGALMSPLTTMQNESIPGIAHAVLLCNSH